MCSMVCVWGGGGGGGGGACIKHVYRNIEKISNVYSLERAVTLH